MDIIAEYKNFALLSLSAIGLYTLFKKITNSSAPSSHANTFTNQLHYTPLLYVKSLSSLTKRNIYLKCESSLPFSHRDRVITNIILNACSRNTISPSTTTLYCAVLPAQILSYVSICKHFGFKCVLVVPLAEAAAPPFVSQHQTAMCSIVVTKNCPYSNFNDNYIRKAKKLARCDPNGFYVDVHCDTVNMQTHYNETGKEIYEQLKGRVDVFVCCCCDTGGTVSGVSNYLKDKKADVKVAVGDAKGSGVYNYVTHGVLFSKEGKEGCIRNDGDAKSVVGCKFLTPNIERAKIDKAYNVSDEEIQNMKLFIENNEKIGIDDATAVNLVTVMKVIEDKWVETGGNVVSVMFEKK